MIIARIIPHSGLGNQMFMYAAGLSLSQRLGTELRLGAWDFENNQFGEEVRPYQLTNFPEITERNASFRELLRICPGQIVINLLCYKRIKRRDIFRRGVRKLMQRLRLIPDVEAREKSVRFSRVYVQRPTAYSEFETLHDNILIVGYWESEKYFASISDTVRKKFTFSPEFFNPELSEKVKTCNSVAIHVRRGDKTNINLFFPSDERYIRLAVEKILSLTENPSFFVFSDDIEWCRKNLPLIHDSEYTFIEGQTPPQDMALMSLCRHVIMGSSTFSWWGAWLSEYPGKIVIAPDVNLWYKSGCYNSESVKDLLPERWIKIQ